LAANVATKLHGLIAASTARAAIRDRSSPVKLEAGLGRAMPVIVIGVQILAGGGD
jgi:hypothetical protein